VCRHQGQSQGSFHPLASPPFSFPSHASQPECESSVAHTNSDLLWLCISSKRFSSIHASCWKRSLLRTDSSCMKDILCSDRSCIREAYSEDDAEPASEFAFFLGALDESSGGGLSVARYGGRHTLIFSSPLPRCLSLLSDSCHRGSDSDSPSARKTTQGGRFVRTVTLLALG